MQTRLAANADYMPLTPVLLICNRALRGRLLPHEAILLYLLFVPLSIGFYPKAAAVSRGALARHISLN